jgi:cellulose synthase operon protein C
MKTHHRVLLGLASVVVLAGGLYAARTLAWPAVKTARIDAMNRDAAAFLAAGDPANALLTARKSLKSTTRNPEAWRIAATAAAARNQPDAIWYQDNLSREAPTLENRLELLSLAVRFDAASHVAPLIDTMAAQAGDHPEYHRLAAQLRLRAGDTAGAQRHLDVLTRLDPSDVVARLDLAERELAADPGRRDPALRERVLALADHPAIGLRAVTLLLRENVASRHVPGTAELVRRARLAPDPDFSTRLLIAEALALLGDPEAPGLLARLQTDAAARPAEAAAIIALRCRLGEAAAVAPWFATLPAPTRADERVQRQVAEALLSLGDAPALEDLLRGERWTEREYLRAAFLAHALRAQGKTAEFSQAWRLALVATGSDAGRMTDLLTRVDGWRWVAERHEVVWKLFGLFPDNTSIQEILVLWERYRGDTANLRRLFARIVEVSPSDDTARNNLAYTSLLIDVGAAQAGLAAAELATRYPENPYYVTTHALALYKQGDPAAALERLDRLSAAERAEPVRQLLRALCLVSLGRAGPAADLLDGVDPSGLLLEERRFATDIRLALERSERAADNQNRLLALDLPASENGWLAAMDDATRDAATTEMRLADSLLASGDWTSLDSLLASGGWPTADYLRSALAARAARETRRPGESREAWLQALALAGRNPARLQNLRALADRWSWTPERIETVNLLFELQRTDRRLLSELLDHYRAARRTPDMLRVLGLYIGDQPGTGDEAVLHAYYSLLLDTSAARAEVTARTAWERAPADPLRRFVQACALLKQQRAAESLALLETLGEPVEASLKSAPLWRALALTQLGRTEAARLALVDFDRDTALPEEIALADKLARQLAPSER